MSVSMPPPLDADLADLDRSAPLAVNGVSNETKSFGDFAQNLPAAASPIPAERAQLLSQVERDREELVRVAARLRGPVQTLESAKNALVFTGRSIRWIVLAGNVATIAMWLRTGRRPPIALLIGISIQLITALSNRRRDPKPVARARLAAP